MNDVVFLSDMDGTLTPSRQPMEETFAGAFSKLLEGKTFYIVTGSDLSKIKEQIPEFVMERFSGVYASMGNEFFIKNKQVYKNEFVPEGSLLSKLEEYIAQTRYPGKLYPNHIERRCGMVNFCVVGRDCPLEARFQYQAWDNSASERKAIAHELSGLFPQYKFEIGGAISIDIVPHGFGKEQAADKVRTLHPTAKIVFFGDRTAPGGNDYAVAERLRQLGNCEIVTVSEPADVLRYMDGIAH